MLRTLSAENRAATKCDPLVEQAQCVTHAAVGGPRDESRASRLESNTFFGEDVTQGLANLVGRQSPQIKLKTSGQHGDRQLLRVGGRQQKFHMGWRLFEGLEQRV